MKNKFLIIFLYSIHNGAFGQTGVTYELSGGRLGDNLISLIHALWVEYKFGIPLFYRPFPYADQLKLADSKTQLQKKHEKMFSRAVYLRENSALEFNPNVNALYVIPFFPESMEEHRQAYYSPEISSNLSPTMTRRWPYLHIDWHDERFISYIKSLIAPRIPVKTMSLPSNVITVALHIRKNSGGLDLPLLSDTAEENYKKNQQYMDVNYPLKFPPNSYYLQQLKLLSTIFQNKQMYVYIFTDDPQPEKIAKLYTRVLNNSNITFDYRKENNSHTTNVLDDFFALFEFDCLIRSDSNFALIASKLGNNKIVISPLHHVWHGRTLYIDKVNVEMNDGQK